MMRAFRLVIGDVWLGSTGGEETPVLKTLLNSTVMSINFPLIIIPAHDIGGGVCKHSLNEGVAALATKDCEFCRMAT